MYIPLYLCYSSSMIKEKAVFVGVRLYKEDRRLLKARAKKDKMHRAEVIRAAIRTYCYEVH